MLVYADDIKLLVDMCKRFGDKNDLFFNSKKRMCIKFDESDKCSPIVQYPITLSGKQLKLFSSVKHLGQIFDCSLSFTKDVVRKKGKFVACINNIVTEFWFAHTRCKAKMVKKYGTSFYGSCLWDLFGPDCKKLFTTWNIAMRIILEFPNTTHRRFLDQMSGLNHIHRIYPPNSY